VSMGSSGELERDKDPATPSVSSQPDSAHEPEPGDDEDVPPPSASPQPDSSHEARHDKDACLPSVGPQPGPFHEPEHDEDAVRPVLSPQPDSSYEAGHDRAILHRNQRTQSVLLSVLDLTCLMEQDMIRTPPLLVFLSPVLVLRQWLRATKNFLQPYLGGTAISLT